MKISATHEYAKPNRYLFARDYREIPLSLFADLGMEAHLPGPHVFADRSDQKLGKGIKDTMEKLGIACAYGIPLTSGNGSLIGFISVSYCDLRELTHDELDKLANWSTRISVTLESLIRSPKVKANQ